MLRSNKQLHPRDPRHRICSTALILCLLTIIPTLNSQDTVEICQTVTPCMCVSQKNGFLIDLARDPIFPKIICSQNTTCYIWQPCNSFHCGDEAPGSALCERRKDSTSSSSSSSSTSSSTVIYTNLGNMQDARFKRDLKRNMIFIQYANPNVARLRNRVYLICPRDYQTPEVHPNQTLSEFRLYEVGPNNTFIDFAFISPHACFLQREGVLSAWLTIGLFIIACLFILVCSYCLIGILANYFLAGRRDVSLIPHHKLWTAILCSTCCKLCCNRGSRDISNADHQASSSSSSSLSTSSISSSVSLSESPTHSPTPERTEMGVLTPTHQKPAMEDEFVQTSVEIVTQLEQPGNQLTVN